MSTATQATVKQLNAPGQPASPAPEVTKITYNGGAFPSAAQAKAQVKEQQSLDTTVLDAGSGKGHSKLPGDSQKKAPAPKADAKAEPKKEAPADTGGQKEAAPSAEEVEQAAAAKKANAALERSRARDKELKDAKAQLAELQAQLPKTKEYEELFRNAKKDPIGFLQKAGLDLETVAQAALNGGKRPEELVKLEEMEQKLKDRDEREAREKQQAEHRAHLERVNAGIAQHFTEVNQTITSDTEKYEFCNLKMQGERIPLTIDNGSTFMVEPAIADGYSIQEHAAKELGRVLTPTELADALESYYESEFAALKGTRKIQKLLGLAGDDKEDKPKKSGKKESPTLGGRKLADERVSAKTPLPKLNRKDFKSDKDFMQAIVRQGEERMKLLKETKA